MTTRVANKNARVYVQDREEFIGSNTFAVDTASTTGTDLYIVYSYGEHYPMFIAEEHGGVVVWYENTDSYSRSTSRQHTQLHPHETTTRMDTQSMRRIAMNGIVGLATLGPCDAH